MARRRYALVGTLVATTLVACISVTTSEPTPDSAGTPPSTHSADPTTTPTTSTASASPGPTATAVLTTTPAVVPTPGVSPEATASAVPQTDPPSLYPTLPPDGSITASAVGRTYEMRFPTGWVAYDLADGGAGEAFLELLSAFPGVADQIRALEAEGGRVSLVAIGPTFTEVVVVIGLDAVGTAPIGLLRDSMQDAFSTLPGFGRVRSSVEWLPVGDVIWLRTTMADGRGGTSATEFYMLPVVDDLFMVMLQRPGRAPASRWRALMETFEVVP